MKKKINKYPRKLNNNSVFINNNNINNNNNNNQRLTSTVAIESKDQNKNKAYMERN